MKKITSQVREQIETQSRTGKLTQKQIAAELGLCPESVGAVQKSLGLQPQPMKKTRGPLSEHEKRQIRRLHGKGLRATEIAARMQLTRNTVGLAKRKMHLTTLPPLPESKILSLQREGVDQRQIARMLKVPYRRVAKFARANGYARPRHVMTPEQVAAIDDAILNREATAISIAKSHGASYKYVLHRAHLLLECERFLGISKPPLTSYFPSRPSPIRLSETMSAEKFVERFFHFAPRPGVVIGDVEVGVAARILLHTRVLFFGRPQNEVEYLRELQNAVAAHLAHGVTSELVH